MSYTESEFEKAVIELVRDRLGYTYAYGPDISRDYHNPLYEDMLKSSLRDINPSLPADALHETLYKLKNFETGSLVQKNEVFTDYLQNGVDVGYFDGGAQKYARVRLIDYDRVENNRFFVINQWTVVENSEKRPDVVVFINGLPLVVVELKSCSREEADVSNAFRQLRNYTREIPCLFTYNAFCIMSDFVTSKAGTLTADEGRFMEWKTTDGDYEETQYARFDVLFEGMLEKRRLLEIIKSFILFSKEEGARRQNSRRLSPIFRGEKSRRLHAKGSRNRRKGRHLLAHAGQRKISLDGLLCKASAKCAQKPDDCRSDRPKRS